MNPITHLHDTTTIDPDRLRAWFPVADTAEIAARQSDPQALIDYLSFCNDLTRTEAREMLETALPPAPEHPQRSLRAA